MGKGDGWGAAGRRNPERGSARSLQYAEPAIPGAGNTGAKEQPLHALSEMSEIAARHATAAPHVQTLPVPRLGLFCADKPTVPTPTIYEPMLCLVISGRKRGFVGRETIEYNTGDALLVTVDLPIVGEVIEADPSAPYLSLVLELNRPTLASILLECEADVDGDRERMDGFRIGRASPEVLDAALRLLRLLDRPQDIPVLAPLTERELLYRLMTGPTGNALRQIARADSRMSQVTRAVSWLRQNYTHDYSANELAEIASMSVASLNRHFRSVTAMSPLEYQKRIRLQEARRLLYTSQADVAGVGYAVGYGSASQFTREYRRLFGESPGRDAERLRSAGMSTNTTTGAGHAEVALQRRS